jgi:hypothetical protein
MHPVMAVLAAGVPLTLLLDLQRAEGPDSRVIYLTEQPIVAASDSAAQ